jgi:protein SCO1/2
MTMRLYSLIFCLAGLLMSAGCASDELPILGQPKVVDGREIPHFIPDFSFVNQDGAVVTNETFSDRVYVADFFFTSCPTICPKVKAQMLRIYERFEDEDRLALLSHSIDTKRDTVGRLKVYAENLGVSTPKWHFVTGDKDEIYAIADDYFNIVIDDESAPGGFDHSGRLVLIDQNRHLRSYCNGTDPEEVDRFMRDIDKLLRE